MKKIILFSVITAVGITGAIVSTLFFTGAFRSNAEQSAQVEVEQDLSPKDAIYHEFHPSFVVNFEGNSSKRFMQLDLVAMAYEEEAIEALKHHMPLVRNNLLMVFGVQGSESLATREGKEHLRQEALKTVQLVMEEHYGKEGIADIYFTKFVMQ